MDAKREVVELLQRHGALADPTLVADLAEAQDGVIRLQAVLDGLKEIPFHFDADLFRRLEEQTRDAAIPEAPVRVATQADVERKAAMKRAAAAIYDGKTKPLDPDADDDVEDVPDLPEAPKHDAVKEAKEFAVTRRSDWQPMAAQHASGLEIHQDMTGNSTCEGRTSDFVTYFQDRYNQIHKMLRKRRELVNATKIDRINPGQVEVAIIGMVIETSATKNGHQILEVEDETGMIRALANLNEKQLLAMAQTLVRDEVVGLVGQVSPKGDMVFLTDIIRPDIPRFDPSTKRGADIPLMAAFLSDIHVGSNTFLPEQWKQMLRWLSGDAETKRQRDAAGRVKYLVIPGDLVDGVGIYPGQQDELTIGDVYDQYGTFGDWMKHIPEHIELIVQPGNHDAVRPAEPQPAFSADVQERFDHHDAKFVANPAYFSMHGVKTLGYHGSSLIDFATSVTNLEYEKPLDSMEQMLQTRHLAPLYGERTPVAPEHHDYLVIDDVPDLFVTGHVHVPGIRGYRGVQMVNCGTWQAQTSYQKMLNFTPEPAKMPLMDLQTLRGTLVDFQTPEAVGQMG